MIVGTGVDIVETARVAQALRRTPALKERVFTAAEREYAAGKRRASQSYALAFAAKEAAFKALRLENERPRWQEIELAHEADGLPVLRLYGETAAKAAALGIDKWHISCSHSDTQAICFVIAEKAEGGRE